MNTRTTVKQGDFQAVRPNALDVAIVGMPFASAAMPSIQVGTVTGIVQGAGFPVESYHFNLDLAAELGEARYELLCEHRGVMTGEWLFAVAAHGADAPDPDDRFTDVFSEAREALLEQAGFDRGALRMLRHEVLPAFVDRCAEQVIAAGHDVIGLTTTFQQTNACLALAKRVKAALPETHVILGGANCDHPMGGALVQAFDHVDFAISGEAEVALPRLLAALEEDRAADGADIGGVVSRTNADSPSYGVAPLVPDLNVTPIPCYDEFFERSADLGIAAKGILPMETSRGCWWGVRHHCTFCGLNGHNMRYRMKSAPRIMRELQELSVRHNALRFETTDNILAPKLVKSVFADMAEQHLDLEFFFEVKTNLKREQLAVLAAGGLRRVQPGIESLSSRLLSKLRKGSTAIENVQFMKWCLYYGIKVSWNLLCGVPGETAEDYATQLALLARIPHLEPPSGLTPIWLERYSPMFNNPAEFGITGIAPERSYSFAFPKAVDLDKLAYFFDYEVADVCEPETLAQTEAYVAQWMDNWDREVALDMLTFRRTFDGLIVEDRRDPAQFGRLQLTGDLAAIYGLSCESPVTVAQVMATFDQETGGPSEAVVSGALEAFVESGLAIEGEGQFLGLALPKNKNWS